MIDSKNKIPDQIFDEIPCLNNMGYQKTDLDEYSKEFIDLASNSRNGVLEVGSAYGLVAHEVIKRGGKIIACDMEQKHLNILYDTAPQEFVCNLKILRGVFPDELELENQSVDAVLISRVIHFLRGEDIKRGFVKIHQLLTDGGKLYVTVVSPYVESLVNNFLPIYKSRVKSGKKWPGIITNHRDLAPRHAPYLGDFLHVFDIPELEKLLPECGFKIERISYFDYPNEAINSEGKGHIGFVAQKI